MKIDWVKKLTSRKFWVALTDFVSMMIIAFGFAEELAVQVSAIIMAGAGLVAYIIAEGLVDSKTTVVEAVPVEAIPVDEDFDESFFG